MDISIRLGISDASPTAWVETPMVGRMDTVIDLGVEGFL